MRPDIEVSVIMPVFNRVNLAREAVCSALAQVGINLEIVVVDDGSDESLSLSEVLPRQDSITLIRTDHTGISAARNVGISRAEGRFVAFLDSDDLFFPQKLVYQVDALKKNRNLAWSCTGFERHNISTGEKETVSLRGIGPRFWRYDCPIGCTSLVVRREELQDLGGFDEQFEVSEDWDLMIRLGELSEPLVIGEPLYKYRTGCGNISQDVNAKWTRSWNRISEKHQLNGVTCPQYIGQSVS